LGVVRLITTNCALWQAALFNEMSRQLFFQTVYDCKKNQYPGPQQREKVGPRKVWNKYYENQLAEI
jgi:hypothetical protein